MAIEKLTGMDKATLLIESTLGNKETLRGLIIEGNGNKDAILQPLALEVAKLDPSTQVYFLQTLIGDMAIEGNNGVTDRRDGALEILRAEAMKPLVQTNAPALYGAYLEAVKRQGRQNDPISGSIDTLLEAGQVLAPFFSQEPERRKQIREAWTQVTDQFRTPDMRFHIRLKLDEIKKRMSPYWLFYAKVEQLRKQGFSNLQIAERLDKKVRAVEAAAHRLIAAGRIKSARSNSSTKAVAELDSKVEQLRERGLSNIQIAEQLGREITYIQASARRLIAAGRIERSRAGRPVSPATIQLDAMVKQLKGQGLSNIQIAEQLGREITYIQASARRLIAAGRIDSRKAKTIKNN